MYHKFVISVVVVFLALSGLIYYLSTQQPAYALGPLLIGNAMLALVSLLSFNIIKRGIKSGNPNAFVRSKMTGTLLKFFICVAILLIYVFLNDRQIHKPSLFLFLGMYAVYSAIEAVPLSKMARKN
jgi:Ca2+/Na+ antiporter